MRSALVRVVAGLEWLVAEEVTAAGCRVVEVSKRQVVVEGPLEPPRVADDVFEVYGVAPDPGRARGAVDAAVRRAVRAVPEDRAAFAVSASFVGERNFNRYDVEDLVGERLARLTGGRYHSRRGGVVPPEERTEWRVVLDGKTLWVARRAYAVPVHRRPWRQHTIPGSLHPPVAAAMAYLADLASGHQVLDPFCGAGTVLLEAHLLQPSAGYLGVDHNPAAIAAAKANAAQLYPGEVGAVRPQVGWRVGDARGVRGCFDRIVSNPPWGVRVDAVGVAAGMRQWRDVVRPGGLVVALVMDGQVPRGWQLRGRYELAVAGRHPVIVVLEP